MPKRSILVSSLAFIVPLAFVVPLAFAPLVACDTQEPGLYPEPVDPSDPDPDMPTRLETEALTLTSPPSDVTCMAFIPGTSDLLLGTRAGEVRHVRLVSGGEGLPTVEDINAFEVPQVHKELDCGLLAFAFPPDFADSHELYVSHCVSKTESAIRRLPLDPATWLPIAGADVDIFRAGDPLAQRPWHNVGAIGFEPDGTLWALFGDKTVSVNGQDLDDALGALVRMIPNRDAAGATPAPDNPFVAAADGKSPWIYAWGLRSPWRGTRDAAGRWFIGDVGQDTYEEVNVVTGPADNFGWSEAEGPCQHDCEGFTDPTVWWSRSEDDPTIQDDLLAEPTGARAAWVGPSYEVPAGMDRYGGLLDGRILYGDLCVGFLRGLVVDNDGVLRDDRHLGHLPGSTAMAIGPDGYLYAATFGKCMTESPPEPMTLLRLVAKP